MDAVHITANWDKWSWRKYKIPLDQIADKIAALGVPGLILLAAIYLVGLSVGLTGAAAIIAALAAIGGTILGGIGVLALIGLLAYGLTEYGFWRIYRESVIKMKAQGYTLEKVLETVDGYPISKKLKARLKEFIREHWEDDDGEDNGSAGQPA